MVSATTNYHSSVALEAFCSTVLITIGMTILFAPMWWLEFVGNNLKRLGIITGFVLFFTALLGIATNAKPYEVLAAATA